MHITKNKGQMKNAKIQAVKEFISQYAGIMVDMTIRDSKSFTFHFDGENNNAMIKIAKYFISGNAKVEYLYDSEVDSTMIFVDVA